MRVRRFHYAWVVVAVTLLTLMAAQAVRAAPGIIIVPLEQEFGWDRAAISLAVGVSLLAFGFGGPLGGFFVDRFGPRIVLVAGLLLIAAGLVALLFVTELWQLYLVWGIVIGVGTGAAGQVVSASIAQRWFRTHRGLVVGLFGGATSAGQLVFVPAMAALTVATGWRSAIELLLGAALVASVPLALFMRNRPSDVGQRAVGEGETLTAAEKADDARRTPVREALRRREFWLLASSFFVCGYTSNGLIGTHLIPHAVEHGFTEVAAASAVALLGALNIVGTLASGWLTDRYDNRRLLAGYYGFRAMSLLALPLIYDLRGLLLFAIVYGLDWIATVPPTVNLTASIFGRASVGTLYGWIWFAHMVGAALAAYAGGFFRVLLGDYHLMFVSAAVLGFIAVSLVSRIPQSGRPLPPTVFEAAHV
ncbi:MAG TPA: MFS transporter [Candidatus Limnocylindria bacterium]|nr:MFS transporter [Candidatus Limnocylindria bacterium]